MTSAKEKLIKLKADVDGMVVNTNIDWKANKSFIINAIEEALNSLNNNA